LSDRKKSSDEVDAAENSPPVTPADDGAEVKRRVSLTEEIARLQSALNWRIQEAESRKERGLSPTFPQFIVHFADLVFTLYVWRGLWMWQDDLMEDVKGDKGYRW